MGAKLQVLEKPDTRYTTAAEAQDLIVRVLEALTGQKLEPNQSALVLPEYVLGRTDVVIRRTSGKGQGMSAKVDQEAFFYLSADNKVCRVDGVQTTKMLLPAEPTRLQKAIFKEVVPCRRNWEVSYWQHNFEMLMELVQTSLENALRDTKHLRGF